VKTINFNEPFLAGDELAFIADVFRQKQFYGSGKYTELCQDFIKKRVGATGVLLTDSCTSALEMSALLLKEDKEQEVILPSYTFSSTASAFARAGFKLIFAEIDRTTMMLDVADVESRITDKTTAVIVVHYGGHCADVLALRSLCDQRNLVLVEDAAQAFDCYLNGKALGTFGTLGCFSFHETKNIHAGLSGALLINDEKMTNRAVHIWERGTNRQEVIKGVVDKYSWVEIGGSFYPTELQAAFLYAQFKGIDRNKNERQAIYQAYKNGLIHLREKQKISFPEYQIGFESNYHAFFVVFNCEVECEKVRLRLKDNLISAYIGYVPLHSSKVGKGMGYCENSLPVTQKYANQVLRLPFHNNMSIGDAERVCAIINSCFEV
jgi:dTDP-4-amino-4,6-dideoxygalactose transaminase